MSERFHLILRPGDQLDPAKSARVLAPIIGRASFDLAAGIRYGGGWVTRHVTLDQAEAVEQTAREQLEVDLLRIPDDVPLEPPVTRRVRSVTFTDERIYFEFPDSEESNSYDEIAALAIMVRGREVEASEETKVRDLGALVATRREFAAHREALSDPEFEIEEAAIEVILSEPIEFLRCQLGVPFPELALDGQLNTIDNWLRFAFHVRSRAPGVALPRTSSFLETADRSTIQFDKPEEMENYRMWIAELVARDHWGSAHRRPE